MNVSRRWPEPRLTASFIITFARLSAAELILRRWIPGHICAAIPGIEPAICNDTRFNHVDAFYKQLFKLHSCEALVSIVKGLRCRMTDKKTKSSRAEATMKRAKDILHGELAVALDMDVKEVEPYIINCIAQAKAES